MWNFLRSPLGPRSLPHLLRFNLGFGLVIFLALEIWRPCYFLTDDNLSAGFPLLTELGRHLKNGQSIFLSNYLFAGHYDFSRDAGVTFWHPFYFLPALLSGTFAGFWIFEIIAFLFLTVTLTGFTFLGHAIAREFNPELPAVYLIFFTFSFVFSTYILVIGPSWVSFLGNQSALPWLTLGIMNRSLVRGAGLVVLFTVHQFLGAYIAMTFSSGLGLSLFALGLCVVRRSFLPLLIWVFGNCLAVTLTLPFLVHVLGAFAGSHRAAGLSLGQLSEYSIPAPVFAISYFIGNWSDIIYTAIVGPSKILAFPQTPTLLACAAAWSILPAVFFPQRWRSIEIVCGAIAILFAVLVVRPAAISVAMHATPFLRSMRWPFRESLQFLFFVHLFLILRPPVRFFRLQGATVLLGLVIFLLPLPWHRVPTLNPLFSDRYFLFSGTADIFWARVRAQLGPTDEVGTVIDWEVWKNRRLTPYKQFGIPYTLLNTANFPCLSRIISVSGYSPAVPSDEPPLKVIPWYLFGAYRDDQIPELIAEKPDLKLIRLEGFDPMKLYLYSKGRKIDLVPDLPPVPLNYVP